MRIIEQYLSKRIASVQPFFPKNVPMPDANQRGAASSVPLCVAVVVPVCDEYPALYETIGSVDASYRAFLQSSPPSDFPELQFRVICVVNNTAGAPDRVRRNNDACLAMLAGSDTAFPPHSVPLEAIDCASRGRELPDGQGVGFARKIGMDYALAAGASVIACLDADTTVSPDYAADLSAFALRAARARNGIAAAVTGFTHRRGETPAAESAVRRYEYFLKEHSRRLRECASVYYPVALGPTIVCSAAAYAACGGMNVRTAGEDFYFLQALIKVCAAQHPGTREAVPALGCTVYPSARISQRVPFGTGRKIAELSAYAEQSGRFAPGTAGAGADTDKAVAGADKAAAAVSAAPVEISGYPDAVYEQLARCIRIVTDACAENCTGTELSRRLLRSAGAVDTFLENENFFSVWEKLRRNNKTASALETAFQCWFDGLKIIRLIHYLMR